MSISIHRSRNEAAVLMELDDIEIHSIANFLDNIERRFGVFIDPYGDTYVTKDMLKSIVKDIDSTTNSYRYKTLRNKLTQLMQKGDAYWFVGD